MRCLVCKKAVPKRGKKKYHEDCYQLDIQRREEDRIIRRVEIALRGNVQVAPLNRDRHGRSKHTYGRPR